MKSHESKFFDSGHFRKEHTMKNTQHTADDFFQNAKKWQEEMLALRSIVLECGLKEEINFLKNPLEN